MSTNSIMEVIITTSADAANMNDLQEGQLVQLTDRDNAFYRATSSANGNYYNAYSVLKTGNAAINLNIQAGDKVTPGMLGFNNPPNQKQTQARHNYLAMYHTFKVCAGKSATVVMPDSDFEMEIDRAIIVPANTTVQWGKGILTPVLSEGMQYYPDETVSRDTSGVAIGYGAIFATGDSQNGRIFSARNQIEMGTVHWIDVKISNIRRTDQGESYSVRSDDKGYLHGILACGGINIFERCHIEGMPDSGIRCDMFEEAHYINTDCSNNGHATRSTDAWAANGIANTGTQAYLDLDDALDTRYATRLLVIEGGRYCGNAKAGIMAAGIPMTRISQVDCTDNGFTAYYGPGESNYKRTAPLKDADGNTVIEQLEITHSYLTGTPGKTVHSIYLRDGYAKQLKLGGNVLGDVTGSAVHADCSELGSIEFTLRNRINFLNDMLQEGCH
ncbi:MAG: hypothetical protein OIF57_11940, partial [Marinobacterium sp.]|nr:hypothetical protein [Marinobacterium sp.]